MPRSEKKKIKHKSEFIEDKNSTFQAAVERAKRLITLKDSFELFLLLDPIYKKKKQSSKRKKTPLEIEFISQVSTVLKIFLAYQRNNGFRCWPELVHEHLIKSIKEGTFQEFFKSSEIEHIHHILTDFVAASLPVDCDNLILQSLIDTTRGLINFLNEHKLDPFSCIIGLTPAKDILETVKSSDNDVENYNIKELGGTREEILQRIISWSGIKDSDELQKKVREYVGSLRGIRNLKRGNIIIVERKKDTYSYARFICNSSTDNTVNIFLDPYEKIATNVRLDVVYPLNQTIINRISSKSPKQLEKLIQSPTDLLFQNIMQTVEKKTHGYFENNLEIDMAAIRQANMNQCSISELQKLTQTRLKLQELIEKPPKDLFIDLNAILTDRIISFKKNIKDEELFIPTIYETYKQLDTLQVSALVMMHIQRYIGICDSGLDQLKLQKRELMSGERKDKISEWWLHEINVEVLAYLENLGYIYDAVPDNYVEHPPKDLEAVRNNVKIISPLLQADQTSTGLADVIKLLQNRIYPKIRTFISDAKIVLSEQFNMDLTGKDFNLTLVEETFEKEKLNIESQSREWIDDMIKDIHYLNEMEKLEDPEYANGNEVSLHIVPISGLVVGMICRLENECKTVCELWEPVDYDEENRSILHEAISNGDIEQVVELLSNSPTLINQPDGNGFTPLHTAASSYTKKHLQILEKMLNISDIEINKKTHQGNTPLYYLVRHPVENTEHKELLLRILSKLTQLNANLNAKNNIGETCLHSACVLDNPEVVKLLIACGAEPTEVNNEGETCIFTAIRGSNIAVVKALLNFGVSKTTTANGKLPLDIAKQLNDTPMIQLLSGKDIEIPTTDRPKTKYKKSNFNANDKFWTEDRVSMRFSMEDLKELDSKPIITTSSSPQTIIQEVTRRSTIVSTPPSKPAFLKAETWSPLSKDPTTMRRLSNPQKKGNSETWSPLSKSGNYSQKKRTKISMGSNRSSDNL